MSNSHYLRVGPVSPLAGARPVQPIRRDALSHSAAYPNDVAAATGGSLRGAYAQLVGNADNDGPVIRVRDAATHQVIHEYSSSEVEHMDQKLKDYAEMLSRRAIQRSAGS
jgi:hypothetical protein